MNYISSIFKLKVNCAMCDMSSDTLSMDRPCDNLFEHENHFSYSFGMFWHMFENEEMCDIELKAGERSIKCHRVVLASCSQYFKAMFTSDMSEVKQDVVEIVDIDPDSLFELIRFVYTSKMLITVDSVQSLLYVASFLQIESAAEACSSFMKSHLHPSNCVEVCMYFFPFVCSISVTLS